MAGNFYGGDVAQLRQLAKDLAGGANRLNAWASSSTAPSAPAPWKGHDGDRFRSEWTSSHSSC